MKFVASTDIADLGFSYVAVLENAADAATIADFWQSHPEIANAEEHPSEFEDGMLFAKFVDLKSGETVWKHTYHGLVALDMPEEPRRQRLHEIIELFLATYPQ